MNPCLLSPALAGGFLTTSTTFGLNIIFSIDIQHVEYPYVMTYSKQTIHTLLGDKYYKRVKSKELWEGVTRYILGVGKKGFSREVEFQPTLMWMI